MPVTRIECAQRGADRGDDEQLERLVVPLSPISLTRRRQSRDPPSVQPGRFTSRLADQLRRQDTPPWRTTFETRRSRSPTGSSTRH